MSMVQTVTGYGHDHKEDACGNDGCDIQQVCEPVREFGEAKIRRDRVGGRKSNVVDDDSPD